jgi:hypothetical protein
MHGILWAGLDLYKAPSSQYNTARAMSIKPLGLSRVWKSMRKKRGETIGECSDKPKNGVVWDFGRWDGLGRF